MITYMYFTRSVLTFLFCCFKNDLKFVFSQHPVSPVKEWHSMMYRSLEVLAVKHTFYVLFLHCLIITWSHWIIRIINCCQGKSCLMPRRERSYTLIKLSNKCIWKPSVYSIPIVFEKVFLGQYIQLKRRYVLTHWGGVTHICVSKTGYRWFS